MTEAVIVATARTAIGTSFKGTLRATPATDLAEAVVAEVLSRSKIDPQLVDDLVLGEVMQAGGNIARHTAVRLGLTSVPGLADQRQCASSLSSVAIAAGKHPRRNGHRDHRRRCRVDLHRPVIRKQIDADTWDERWMPPSHPNTPEAPNRDMSITVGWNTAQQFGITREQMDAWAFVPTNGRSPRSTRVASCRRSFLSR